MRLRLSAGLCVFVVFALWGSSASAFRGHVFGKAFAGEGTGPGQLDAPKAVAVNEATGDVYVADTGNDRVEIFTNAGTLVGEINGSGTLPNEGGIAAGNGKYSTETPPEGVSKETPTGRFVEPESVAVDNTCKLHEEREGKPLSASACNALDPSNGDVYIVDTGHQVLDKYSPTGAYLGQVSEIVEDGTERTFILGVLGVAVDTTGQVWLAEGHYEPSIIKARVQGVDRFSSGLVHDAAVEVSPTLVGFLEDAGLA